MRNGGMAEWTHPAVHLVCLVRMQSRTESIPSIPMFLNSRIRSAYIQNGIRMEVLEFRSGSERGYSGCSEWNRG